jgi:hypothetical protein
MAISGVVCRCGNYPHEVEAILAAAGASGVAAANPVTGQRGVFRLGGGRNKPFPRTDVDPRVEIHRDAASQALVALQRSPRPLDGHAKATGKARYAGDIGFHPDDPVRSHCLPVRCPRARRWSASMTAQSTARHPRDRHLSRRGGLMRGERTFVGPRAVRREATPSSLPIRRTSCAGLDLIRVQ